MTRIGPSVFDRRRGRVPVAPQVASSPTTTRQAQVLNSAIVGSPGAETGIAVGVDVSSGAAMYHDVFTRYEDKKLSNPNVVIVGPVGAGKSVLCKNVYVMRQSMLVRRRGVILDPTRRGTDGDCEYGAPTRHVGGEPHLMWPGHELCATVNPLDGIILAGAGRSAAYGLLSAFAELGDRDGTAMSALEHDVLTTGHRAILQRFEGKRTPTLPDLVELMPDVVNQERYARYRASALDKVAETALLVDARLRRALADDVAGLFDGDTSKGLTDRSHKLMTYNLANLPKQGPAMPMVMAAVHAVLMGDLSTNRDRWRTTLVMEEAWAFESVAKQIRANEKLARKVGLSNVGVMQHVSDARPGTDGEALVREAGTAHIFRQEQQSDIDDCVAAFGLDPANGEVLQTLPQGEHLLKVGSAREVHLRVPLTDTEYRITETDEAMKGNL